MGCGGSKNTKTKDGTESDTEDYDSYRSRNKSNKNTPRNKHNNNVNYSNNNKGTPQKSGATQTSPETKYTVNNYHGSVSDDYPEAYDKQGYKRRIRSHLVQTTKGSNLEALEKAIEKFEKNKLEDYGDLGRAKERLEYLKLKRDLRDAIRRSNVGVLERTIDEAHRSRYSGQLRNQIDAAERKLNHLRELNKYNHDILTMDQVTISEIHSYHRPPACVHDVMAASYMLLGHEESTLRDWSYLQSMAGKVGKDSLMHKVREFDSSNVDDKTAARVKEILNYHDLGEVRVASNGAATFHVWASNIVDMIENDKEEEYEIQRKQEEDRIRREAEEEAKAQKELASKNAATKAKKR